MLLNYWSIVDVVGCAFGLHKPGRHGPLLMSETERASESRPLCQKRRTRTARGPVTGGRCGLAQVAGERVSPFLKPTQELLGSRRLGLYMSVSLVLRLFRRSV